MESSVMAGGTFISSANSPGEGRMRGRLRYRGLKMEMHCGTKPDSDWCHDILLHSGSRQQSRIAQHQR